MSDFERGISSRPEGGRFPMLRSYKWLVSLEELGRTQNALVDMQYREDENGILYSDDKQGRWRPLIIEDGYIVDNAQLVLDRAKSRIRNSPSFGIETRDPNDLLFVSGGRGGGLRRRKFPKR